MIVQQPAEFTPEAHLPETPMEIGPWGLSGEVVLPTRQVVWTALAFVLLTLGVLMFA